MRCCLRPSWRATCIRFLLWRIWWHGLGSTSCGRLTLSLPGSTSGCGTQERFLLRWASLSLPVWRVWAEALRCFSSSRTQRGRCRRGRGQRCIWQTRRCMRWQSGTFPACVSSSSASSSSATRSGCSSTRTRRGTGRAWRWPSSTGSCAGSPGACSPWPRCMSRGAPGGSWGSSSESWVSLGWATETSGTRASFRGPTSTRSPCRRERSRPGGTRPAGGGAGGGGRERKRGTRTPSGLQSWRRCALWC